MPRTAALRASMIFALVAFLFGAVGINSHALIAEALFLISASVSAVLLLVGLSAPAHIPVPARLSKNRL